MTTREAVAVPRTEAKERKGWSWIRRAAGAVVAVPLLLVGVLVDAAVFAQVEEHGDGLSEGGEILMSCLVLGLLWYWALSGRGDVGDEASIEESNDDEEHDLPVVRP